MSEGEQSIWKDSSNPRVKFANGGDFLESDISENCRKSYEAYIHTEDTTKLEKNKKGYYVTKWSYDDKDKKASYSATYSDDFGWGVMKVPLKESTAEKYSKMDRIEKLLLKLCEYHKINVE
jgi:hypothetical protein